MKLISFSASNVYRQFNFDVKFYPNVSILYGINGSGKTTVLKLINYVISGRFPDLLKIDFNELILRYNYENSNYYLKIISKIEKGKDEIENSDEIYDIDEYELREEWNEEKIGKELRFETNHSKLKSVLKKGFKYKSMQNFKNLIELNHIRKQFFAIFNVIFLSIERRSDVSSRKPYLEKLMYDNEFFEYLERRYGKSIEILAPDFEEIRKDYDRFRYLQRRRILDPRYKSHTKEILKTPLREVQNMIIKAFNDYFRYCSKLDSSYQQDLYEKLVDFDNFSDVVKKLSQSNSNYIKIAKDRIINQIKVFANEFNIHFKYEEKDFQNLIDNFEVERTKVINNQSLNNDYLLNFVQFIKLDESAKLLEENNILKSEKYRPFKLLLDKLGEFFAVTNKIAFLDKAGVIKFKLKNKEIISVKNLSSGEQQILIFFTYLIFKGRDVDEPIMLYDEPELSLHLDWQAKFIESILEINPTIQIILATHAPAIGAKFPENYVEIKSINAK